jgi:hypothetical protein
MQDGVPSLSVARKKINTPKPGGGSRSVTGIQPFGFAE